VIVATYKMVQIPPNITVAAKSLLGKAPDPSQVAAQYLEAVVNRMAADGWAFHWVDAIGVTTTPGCLAGLLGHKASDATYYVVTFRKD
jgi:hypothetical protein